MERETGIRFLLQQDRFDDLSLLFNLYQDNAEALIPIATAVKDHVSTQGEQLLRKVEFPEDNKDHTKIKEILASSQLIE